MNGLEIYVDWRRAMSELVAVENEKPVVVQSVEETDDHVLGHQSQLDLSARSQTDFPKELSSHLPHSGQFFITHSAGSLTMTFAAR